MFVNCNAKIKIYGEYIDTVQNFKYLGLELLNASMNPEGILQARLVKANGMF